MSIETAGRWLTLASLMIILLGIAFAASTIPALQMPLALLTDLTVPPLDGLQQIGASETRLFIAIGGGVMVGWGVMMLQLVHHLLPVDPLLARKLLINSTVSWYFVDSLGSIAAGGYINALLNTALAAVILYPAMAIPNRRSARQGEPV